MFKKSQDPHVNPKESQVMEQKVPWGVFSIAASVIAVIFLAYEVVERLWLSEVHTNVLHMLHIIRGVGASSLVGFLVGWYILRKGGSLFPSKTGGLDSTQSTESVPKERLIHFVSWFIKMRWLACIVAITLMAVTIHILEFLEKDVFGPLLISILLLAVSNIIYVLLLRRRALIKYLREMQIVSDLFILTIMLHYSGGIENPLFLVYVFHVIISGILLNRRKCYAVVGVAVSFFGLMAFLELFNVIDHYTLAIFPHEVQGEEDAHAAHQLLYVSSVVGLQFILMSLAAYFTTTIMGQLRSEETHARRVGQRLQRVLQASGAGFAILDRRLRSLWLNRQIREWLCLPGKHHDQVSRVLAEWIGGEKGPARRTFNDGCIRVLERHRIDSDGHKRFFQVTVSPLLDDEGHVFQVVELTQDITQQKLLEAEMMHSAKMAALGVMAAGVAHEVGNPLASISTRLSLLKESHEEGFLHESIRLLENEISRIGRILRGVSQLARPGQVAWNTCRINSIVAETLTVLGFDPRAKACRIESHLGRPAPHTIGSRDELFQVFLNLGLNAFEKMEQGGTLTVNTRVVEGEIKVSFADTGEGMSKEVLSKIFTPFFSTKKQGLGLGLYMAHNIIHAHGGEIDVQSKLGAGTVMTVILPVRVKTTSVK